MTDVPALFQPDMIAAIDAGNKTMTRRFVKPPWSNLKPGDRLWVREQHWRWGRWVPMHKKVPNKKKKQKFVGFEPSEAVMGNIFFGAKPPGRVGFKSDTEPGWHKRPSIFMPKEFSRFTLIVVATKVERLHAITADDCIAEGIRGPNPTLGFASLWSRINGAVSWNSNPPVIATSFRVIRQNIAELPLEVAA